MARALRHSLFLCTLVVWVLLQASMPAAAATEKPPVDLTPRLEAIFSLRAQALLSGGNPPPLEKEYLPGSKTAAWALHHEQGKLRYMKQWAQNRGVQIVEASPKITVQYLGGSTERAKFYVRQSLLLGYVYPGETKVNKFGVGTRHILEIRQRDDQWFISSEWYTDPLGDDTEVPDVTPALVPSGLPLRKSSKTATGQIAATRYDRQGAVTYADTYCGLAWGCGNENKYNPRFQDYNGVGGDCTNFIAQALRSGGKLNVPIITRVSNLAGHLRGSGRANVIAQESFQKVWQRAQKQEHGFETLLKNGDLIAYQEKGKLEHFAIVTSFDSRGYPLVNSHTADRFHVPFDLGWDRKTVYWLFQMRD